MIGVMRRHCASASSARMNNVASPRITSNNNISYAAGDPAKVKKATVALFDYNEAFIRKLLR